MKMRLTLIAGAVVALVIASAAPAAAQTRQGPTPAQVAEVRQAVAEYRTMWMTELDAETRGIARQYGAPTPEALERMLREWEAGGGAMPNVPASVPGKPGASVRKTPGYAPARPAPPRLGPPRPAPARPALAPAPVRPAAAGPAPEKPGEEAPDFVNGAPKEALDTLKADAKVNLDDIRDKAAETANCSPEARSSKQALQGKLDAYRKALADMEAARVDVDREKDAGADLQKYSTLGGLAGGTKAAADAAMDLFGAANSVIFKNKGVDAIGAIYGAATAENGLGRAANAASLAATGLSAVKGDLLDLSTKGGQQITAAVASGEVVTKGLDTLVINSKSSSHSADARAAGTLGNVLQAAGSVGEALGELPGAETVLKENGKVVTNWAGRAVTTNTIKTTGEVFSKAGSVLSAAATADTALRKYNRELDKAFDQVADSREDARQYNALNVSTLRQIDTKRVEFMQKIAALEAEISRSGCVK